MIRKSERKEMQRLEILDIAQRDSYLDSHEGTAGDIDNIDSEAVHPQVVQTVYYGYVAVRDALDHFLGEDPTLEDILQARDNWFYDGPLKIETYTSFSTLADLIERTLDYHYQLAKEGLEEAKEDPELSAVVGNDPYRALDTQRRLKTEGENDE